MTTSSLLFDDCDCPPDPCDRVPNLQQPEGRPCGHEPRSQEADAGEVPQHEQAGRHQRAVDKVRFL